MDPKFAIQLWEINRKDEEKSARISCPICFDEISEKRKWTAFHTCGHRTCCNCYNGLAKNIHGNRLCPICRTVISVCVTLEGIYWTLNFMCFCEIVQILVLSKFCRSCEIYFFTKLKRKNSGFLSLFSPGT